MILFPLLLHFLKSILQLLAVLSLEESFKYIHSFINHVF